MNGEYDLDDNSFDEFGDGLTQSDDGLADDFGSLDISTGISGDEDGDGDSSFDQQPDDHPPQEYSENESLANPEPLNNAFSEGEPSDNEQKPFLKTPIGMAAVGLGVAMIGVVGFAGFSAISGSDEQEHLAQEGQLELQAPVAGDQNFSDGSDPVQSGAAVGYDLPPLIPGSKMEQPGLPATPALPAAIQLPESDSPQKALTNDSSDEDIAQLKLAVLRQKSEIEELKGGIASISQGVSRMSAMIETDRAERLIMNRKLDEITTKAIPLVTQDPQPSSGVAIVAPVKPSGQPVAPVANKPAQADNAKAAGRTRLQGLKVIDATESGKMSVVEKVGSGRVFTLFNGERLGTPTGSMKVTDILDEGKLIFVGSAYYIDTVVAEKPVQSKAKSSKKTAQVVKNTNKRSEKAESPSVSTSSDYTLNAVYDDGRAFGLVNKNGEFSTYKINDQVPGVGRISGLDSSGNLKAGGKVIKSLY